MYKNFSIILCSLGILASCSQPVARKPVAVKSGTFLKESVERNKVLVAQEEAIIKAIIAQDSIHTYTASENGFWYRYDTEINIVNSIEVGEDDILTFEYDIAHLDGTIIYSKEALGEQKYAVDKQQIITGLRHGLKLMKQGETVTFFLPSHLAYGYHGDNNNIGTNVPIRTTVTLSNIKKKNENP